jgi:hypothetical protein
MEITIETSDHLYDYLDNNRDDLERELVLLLCAPARIVRIQRQAAVDKEDNDNNYYSQRT